MREDLIREMSRRTDEELFEMLQIHREDWRPEALEIAETEWKRRAISPERIDEIRQAIIEKYHEEKVLAEQSLSWLAGFIFLIGPLLCFLGFPQIIAAYYLYHRNGADQKYKDAWKLMSYGYTLLLIPIVFYVCNLLLKFFDTLI
jgi:hypothetical protein